MNYAKLCTRRLSLMLHDRSLHLAYEVKHSKTKQYAHRQYKTHIIKTGGLTVIHNLALKKEKMISFLVSMTVIT